MNYYNIVTRIKECLSLMENNYGNILHVPKINDILFTFEFLPPSWLAYSECLGNKKTINNIISFNKKYFYNGCCNHNKDLLIEEIIPHELGHTICDLNDIELNKIHGPQWVEFCKLMGGSGETSLIVNR